MADFSFILPSGPASAEGGGAYITGLAAALRSAGHGVWFGDGPASAARVIDGRALPKLGADLLTDAIGLVHHPAALAEAGAHDAVHAAERERLPRLRRIVATSEPIRDRLADTPGIKAGTVRVVRPGVPEASRSEGSAGTGCTLLSLGALVPRKGHAVLLRALARLFDLPWRLVIVGDTDRDPAYVAALHDQLAACRCGDRVRLAGTLDDAALDAAWQRADMFALATEWEGYSAPVAEAFRRGLPVAVTSGGSAAELVTPERGIVCTPGDADGLSKAMRRLIFDAPLREAMAEAAWQFGQTLPGWPAQAAAFVAAVA